MLTKLKNLKRLIIRDRCRYRYIKMQSTGMYIVNFIHSITFTCYVIRKHKLSLFFLSVFSTTSVGWYVHVCIYSNK